MGISTKSEAEIQNELQLIEAAKCDPAGFRLLYDKYFKTIFTFVDRRIENVEDTSDITSLVFIKALSKLNNYSYRGVPFSAWLYRIAINEINLFYRKSRKERTVTLDETILNNLSDEIPYDYLDIMDEKLAIALSSLSDTETYLLELRFAENKSFKEIGEILSLQEGAAKRRTYRLLDKLKNSINHSNNG